MIFTTAERKLVLQLSTVVGCGRKTTLFVVTRLRKENIPPETFLENKSLQNTIFSQIKRGFLSIEKNIIEQKYKTITKCLLEKNIRVVWQGESTYPQLLQKSEDPPLCLFLRGAFELLEQPCIAVVGTRKITPYGTLATKKIVAELLSSSKVCIVSGAMYGVDECAHQTVLNKNRQTIAVLGYGFSHAYPRSVSYLLDAVIRSGGCLVTEYLPEVTPRPGFFLARNRIIAGLSLATVVIEAGRQSGSHATALRAAELGRGVFTVPGPVTNPYSEGTKDLVNEGATLITSGTEVLASLNLQYGDSSKEDVPERAQRVLDLLRERPCSDNDLSHQLKITGSQLTVLLTELELAGAIERSGILWYLR